MAGCARSSDVPNTVHYADTLFVNGAVYTVDVSRSWATAVGIRDDKIIFVGFDDDARTVQGPATRVIDQGGKMLMPSF